MTIPTTEQLDVATTNIIDKIYESNENIESMSISWDVKEINGEAVLAPNIEVKYFE